MSLMLPPKAYQKHAVIIRWFYLDNIKHYAEFLQGQLFQN